MTSHPLTPPPQTGRIPAAAGSGQRGLWAQVLATVRDLGGTFDQFVHDPHPEVSALGRTARERHPQSADDYFALGDLCARLSAQSDSLGGYPLKAVAAYARASEFSAADARTARSALLDYAFWCAGAARQIDTYDALRAAIQVCERVQQLGIITHDSIYGGRLAEALGQLRERMVAVFEPAPEGEPPERTLLAREIRVLTDEGQTLLRQNQPAEALACFERALRLDPQQSQLWVWKAYALADQGRFPAALESYDRALSIDPTGANVWNSKGLLLMELGRLDQALECFDHALAHARPIATVQATYWLNRGKSLYMLGRYPEALEALERSHDLEPSPESAAGLAACREQMTQTP
ncbi:MAG: hypothetical protein OHK0022_26130 [Roseiflexaceae bacterium]